MRYRNALSATLVLTVTLAGWASCRAGVPIQTVRQLRKQVKDDKGNVTVLYKFDGEHVSLIEQASRRGAEAAEAWKQFDKDIDAIAVVARSPFGGGETASSYWPAQVKPELLRKVVAPLKKRGLDVVVAELPDETPAEAGEKEDQADQGQPQPPTPKPWPKQGFSEDYPFVLVVGMHHEPIPYRSARRTADGKVHVIRSSRVSAWAILFHAPTGSGFWATTAVSRVGYGTVDDPLNVAAETVLGYLDFADLGKHNVPEHIRSFRGREELPALDLAAVLVQTQRPDAVQAVIKGSTTKGAFTSTAWVLRWFNQRGTVQDFRMDPQQAQRSRCVRVSQRVMLRILLLEQLRGMRGLQSCVSTAALPYEEDIEIQPLGATYGGRLGPLSGDDEIVLIAELANRSVQDRKGAFWRHAASAVRNLGQCKVHIDEAMAVAGVYANRPAPRPRRGRRPRPDPLRQAGRAALAELNQTRVEQQKKKAMEQKSL